MHKMKKAVLALAASAALGAVAEGVFAPDRFTFLNIAPFSPGSEAQLAREMVEYRDRTGNDVVLYSLTLNPEGLPAMRKAERLVESYRALRKELDGSGVRLGVLVQAVLGHWPRVDRDEEPWTRSVTIEGKTKRFCPLDPGCRDYFEKVAGMLAREKPCFILFDDDVRAADSFGVECFCDRHVAKFNAENGTKYTADELRAAVRDSKPGDVTSQAFLALQRDFVNGVADMMRAAVDRVDPTIPAGACMPYTERRFAGETARRFAAKGQPPVLRVDNSLYGKRTLAIFPSNVAYTQAIADYWKDVPYLLDESDSWPHNRYSLPASLLDMKLCAGIFCGLRGSKLWHVNAHKGRFPVSRAFTDKLAERRSIYSALVEAVNDTRLDGVWIPSVGGRRTWHWTLGGDEFVPNRSWIVGMAGPFGVPFVCRAASPGSICALGGASAVDAMSDDELKEIFKGRVLVDGQAALALSARGLSDLTGVMAERRDFAYNSERDLENGDVYPFSKLSETPWLTALAPDARTLTHLCYSPYTGSPDVTTVSPASVVSTNKSGGRVLVTAFPAVSSSFWTPPWTDIRKEWFRKMLLALGWNDFEVLADQDVTCLKRVAHDGTAILGVFNSGIDPLKSVPLRTPRPVSSLEILGADGKWRQAPFSKTRNGVDVAVAVPSSQTAFFRVR